jgi:hypothetical protein
LATTQHFLEAKKRGLRKWLSAAFHHWDAASQLTDLRVKWSDSEVQPLVKRNSEQLATTHDCIIVLSLGSVREIDLPYRELAQKTIIAWEW